MVEQTKTVRTLTGRIISDKMDKTITVLIERRVKHPLYGKYISRSSKVKVHDAENVGKVGDIARISASRPISKTKAWQLVGIEEHAS